MLISCKSLLPPYLINAIATPYPLLESYGRLIFMTVNPVLSSDLDPLPFLAIILSPA